MNKPFKNSFVSVFDKHLCHLYAISAFPPDKIWYFTVGGVQSVTMGFPGWGILKFKMRGEGILYLFSMRVRYPLV